MTHRTKLTQACETTGAESGAIDVLIIEPDHSRRMSTRSALRYSGLRVTIVERVADIERWPVGGIVVTDYERFTPWWKAVGAGGVVVIVDTPAEGVEARRRGATTWLSRRSAPDALAMVLRNLALRFAGAAPSVARNL
jgi:hypothetical protein